MMDWLASIPSLLLQLARGVAIGVVFLVPCLAIIWWMNRRDRRQREVQAQIWDLERQIRRESLPDWQREAIEEADRKQVEIHREARRQLGLPEEEHDG
jgi:hypothetical protein